MTTKKSNYNIALTNNRLSIQVSLNGLSFLIVDATLGKALFFKEVFFEETHTPEEVLEELKEIIELHQEFAQNFQEVIVLHENNLNTLVPKDLFDENSLISYLKFNTRLLPTDYVTFDELEVYSMYNVYIPFTNINNYILELYGEFTYEHTASIFIRSVLSSAVKEFNPSIYVRIFEKHFDFVTIKNKEIEFYNSFTYETPEDFIYFILFACEQLPLNPEEVPVYLFGKIEKEDELYSICYDFIRNVHVDYSNSPYTQDSDLPSSILQSKSLLLQPL